MKRTAFVISRTCKVASSALAVGAIVLLMLANSPASAQTFSVLYNFGTTATDPIAPQAPGTVAQGLDGNLYSTSNLGGANNLGTIFMVTPSGTLSVLYSFDQTHGALPYGGLTLGTDGSFYGTTYANYSAPVETGMIFKFTPPATYTVLYQFSGASPDGAGPFAAPIQGTDGNLYGTAFYGGHKGLGSVYRLTPAGKFTTLHSFIGTDGKYPRAPLIQGTDGNLYGTASEGGTGAGDSGTVFTITTTGKFKVLYNFDITHGQQPYAGLVQGNDGNLYGTTTSGGSENSGVIYSITPAGSLTVLRSLSNLTEDGYLPYAGLTLASDGNFYGSATNGGTGTYGTLFNISSAGAYSVLYDFLSFTGIEPEATMAQHTNGMFYGDTFTGGLGSPCACGTYFRLNNGLAPFAALLPGTGKVGKSIGILGQGLTGTTEVSFNGIAAATYQVVSDTYLTATVPSGATTGAITVTTPGGALASTQPFRVTPTIKSFSPSSGLVGTQVIIKGVSLSQTTQVTFNGVNATTFTINSDTEVTATVPTGALTGKIAITTAGGVATSGGKFTVTP
jgi:uncharacterized repeat protein (TIGR03803 family)